MTTLEFWIASVVLAALRRDWQAGRRRSPRRLVGTTLARSTTEYLRPAWLAKPRWSSAKGWGAEGIVRLDRRRRPFAIYPLAHRSAIG